MYILIPFILSLYHLADFSTFLPHPQLTRSGEYVHTNISREVGCTDLSGSVRNFYMVRTLPVPKAVPEYCSTLSTLWRASNNVTVNFTSTSSVIKEFLAVMQSEGNGG